MNPVKTKPLPETRLGILRFNANLSEDDMSNILGINKATYKYKEAEPNKFTITEAITFCQTVGLTLNDVFDAVSERSESA